MVKYSFFLVGNYCTGTYYWYMVGRCIGRKELQQRLPGLSVEEELSLAE